MMASDQLKIFSNALNAQHVNGMTPNDLAINSGKLVKIHERV